MSSVLNLESSFGDSEMKQEKDKAAGASLEEPAAKMSSDTGELAEDTGKPKLKRKNRSGSEKKRRRRLRMRLAEAEQEATEMRTTTEPQDTSTSLILGKRLLSGSSPEQQQVKQPRVEGHDRIGYRLTLTLEDYPGQQLNQEALQNIEAAIGRLIDGLPEGAGSMPQFADCYLNKGTAIVVCNNEDSRTWLTSQLAKQDVCQDTRLTVVGMEDPPPFTLAFSRVRAWIPGPPVDSTTILRRLELQNEGIYTREWRICSRKEEKRGVHLVISLDSQVACQLLSAKKIFCGAHTASFILIEPGRTEITNTL